MMIIRAWLSLSFAVLLTLSSIASAETVGFVMKPSPKETKCRFVSDLIAPFSGSDEGQTLPIILDTPWNGEEARIFETLEDLKSYLVEIGVRVVNGGAAVMTLDVRPDRVMVFAPRNGSLRALCG